MTPRRMPRCIAWLVKSFSADRATLWANAVQGAPQLIPGPERAPRVLRIAEENDVASARLLVSIGPIYPAHVQSVAEVAG